jgi:hypothetical protein
LNDGSRRVSVIVQVGRRLQRDRDLGSERAGERVDVVA